MERIPLASALSEINRYAEGDGLKEFSLGYVTVEGKKVMRARMTKKGPGVIVAPSKSNRIMYNVKQSGKLHVYNVIEDRVETPFVCLLTHFNGRRIWH